jgi:hypothetical protein
MRQARGRQLAQDCLMLLLLVLWMSRRVSEAGEQAVAARTNGSLEDEQAKRDAMDQDGMCKKDAN